MATKKEPDPPESPKPNREQRRREKFGKAKAVGRELSDTWPESQPNPALAGGAAAADPAAHAGRPDQGVTHDTGPGTGGATQEASQRPEHEGAHAGQSTKG